MNKNIIFLSDVDIGLVGGAQESMKIILDNMGEEFSSKIITPRGSNILKKNQIILDEFDNFTLKNKPKTKIIKLLITIYKIIRKENPDIIHVQMPSTMILIGLLMYLNLLPNKCKVIYTDRGVLNKYGKLTRVCIKTFSKKFDAVVCTTNHNLENYRKLNLVDKLYLIPNTTGNEFEHYDKSLSEDKRRQLGINNEDIVFGFAGRFNKDKNWPLALRIIQELKKLNIKLKINIAIGTDKSPEMLKSVSQYILKVKEVAGENNVLSLIDSNIKGMKDFYSINDIFILSSSKESFGRTAIEAMSQYNVVYGTRVDGLKEVVNFEENLYDDEIELLNKVKTILDSSSIKESKEKFLNHYEKQYNTRTYINNHESLYKKILY